MIRRWIAWTTALSTLACWVPALAAPTTVTLTSTHRVVYQADPDGDGEPQVFTLLLDRPTPEAVTEDVALNPVIARNGDIYYTRYITPIWGRITKVYHRRGLGAPEEPVTTNELGDEYDPGISRDDQVLVFSSMRYFTPLIGPAQDVIDLIAYKQPFVEQRYLSRGIDEERNPAVDGSGKWTYATVTSDANTSIWRFPFPEGSPERIAGLENSKYTECSWPAVDGQNRWCAYASTRDGNSEIYVRDLVSKTEVRLTTEPGFDGEPAMTEDGTKIVFVSDRDGDKDLYAMNRDGSGLVQLTQNDTTDDAPSVQ
ncbi:MAG: hypothetical protein ABI743_07735 [bacterium]